MINAVQLETHTHQRASLLRNVNNAGNPSQAVIIYNSTMLPFKSYIFNIMSKAITVKDYKMHMLLKSNLLKRKHWQRLVPTLKTLLRHKRELERTFPTIHKIT